MYKGKIIFSFFSYNYLGDIMFPFLISFFAGISTMLGSFILFFRHKSRNSIISKSLSFASGVMIAVSLFDLLPSSLNGLCETFNVIPAIIILTIFVVLGIIISYAINKYIPGFENNDSNRLYKVGIFSMIAIILHNIPEGIATFLTTSENVELGISLAIAIALHNIPEGISISVPIYFSTNNMKKAIWYTFISGMSEFLGAIIAYVFLLNIKSTIFLYILYSLIAGIMLSLVFEELIPNACKYDKKINIIYTLLVGMLFMMIIHFMA